VEDFCKALVDFELDKQQKQGVIDALLLVMYIDGRISGEEILYLDEVAEACSWGDDRDMAQYLAHRRGELLAMLDREADLSAVLDQIKVKVHDREILKELHRLCERMAERDEEVADSEQHLLDALLYRFK